MMHVADTMVDSRDIAQCFEIYKDPTIRICMKRIMNDIWGGGVTFSKNGERINPNVEFMSIFEKYWIKFCNDCVESIMVMGHVPVAIQKDEKGVLYPVVPPIGTYTIGVRQEEHRLKYQFYGIHTGSLNASILGMAAYNQNSHHHNILPTSSILKGNYSIQQKSDEKVIIMSGFENDITYEGKLRSDMWTVSRQKDYLHKMEECAINAEKLNSNPVVFLTEIEKNASALLTRGGSSYLEGVSDQSQISSIIQEKLDRDQLIRERLRNSDIKSTIHRLAAQESRTDHAQASGISTDCLPVQIALPHGTQIAHQLMAHTRGDLVALRKQVEDIMYEITGVPRSVFASDTLVRGNTEGMNATLESTLKIWKIRLKRIVNEVYQMIYGNMDKNSHIHRMTKKLHKAYQQDNVERVNSVEQKVKRMESADWTIIIDFPSTQRTDTTEVYEAYQKGIIDHSQTVKLIYAKLGLSEEEAKKAKDLFSEEEKRAIRQNGMGILGFDKEIQNGDNSNQSNNTFKEDNQTHSESTSKANSTRSKRKATYSSDESSESDSDISDNSVRDKKKRKYQQKKKKSKKDKNQRSSSKRNH